jgi:hypothetical protein
MFLMLCAFLWIMSLLGIFLFGFLLGRCARKLPIFDETLPWTLHWGEIPRVSERPAIPSKISRKQSWPGNPHQNNEADGWHPRVNSSPCGLANCPLPR